MHHEVALALTALLLVSLSWNVPNLSAHDVVDTNRIAIVLVCRFSFQNDMFTRSGIAPVVPNSNDLSLDPSYNSESDTVIQNQRLRGKVEGGTRGDMP